VESLTIVRRLLRGVLWRRKALLCLVFVAASSALLPSAYYLSKDRPRFRAAATVLLEARDPRVPLFQEFSPYRPLPVQLEVLRSRSLAESVIENLPTSAIHDLLDSPYETDLMGQVVNAYQRFRGVEPRVESPQRRALTELQQSRVSFHPRGQDGIVVISAEATKPQVAVDIVNAYIEALLARTRSFNVDDARVSREFLEQQLSDIKRSLQGNEESLRAFTAAHGGIKLPDQSQATVVRLSETQGALAEVSANRKMLEARLQAVREKLETQRRQLPSTSLQPSAPPAPRMPPSDSVLRLRNQLAQLETTLLDLRTKYTDEHPRIVLVKDRIGELQRHLGDTIKETTPIVPAPEAIPQRERVNFAEQVVLLETSYHALMAQEEALRKQVDTLRRSLGGLSRNELEYTRLAREVDINRNLQVLLADKLLAFRIREQGEMRNVRIIDPAGYAMEVPNGKRVKFISVALLLAVALGFGAPATVEWVHRTVDTQDEAEAATGLPVLALIPRVRTRRPLYGAPSATSARQAPGDDFMFTEALRGLRVAIQLAARTSNLRTVHVASPFENEGKSTIVYNLGLAFRDAGKRVGLADTDFERPSLHLVSKTPTGEGLADVMHARGALEQSLAPVAEGMWLAPRGHGFLAQTRGMMATSRLKEVIDELATHADLVLCDSSPVLLVPESLFLAAAVDAVILVAKAGSTRARDLRRAVTALESVGARVAGVVVNEVQPSQLRSHYNRYYKAYARRAESS
jgi:capsular exopolysaccharide synthesis family protein